MFKSILFTNLFMMFFLLLSQGVLANPTMVNIYMPISSSNNQIINRVNVVLNNNRKYLSKNERLGQSIKVQRAIVKIDNLKKQQQNSRRAGGGWNSPSPVPKKIIITVRFNPLIITVEISKVAPREGGGKPRIIYLPTNSSNKNITTNISNIINKNRKYLSENEKLRQSSKIQRAVIKINNLKQQQSSRRAGGTWNSPSPIPKRIKITVRFKPLIITVEIGKAAPRKGGGNPNPRGMIYPREIQQYNR